MSPNREWMYTMRFTQDGYFNPKFERYVSYFLNFAFSNATNIQRSIVRGVECLEIRCPCSKCKNRYFKTKDMVEFDICKNGFMPAYTTWYAHGESYSVSSERVGQCSNPVPSQHVGRCPNPVRSEDNDYDCGEYTGYDQMILENMHHNNARYQEPQHPNRAARTFYDMLEEANEPLWPGCEKVSKFSFVARLLNWKSECNVSDSTYDKLLPILKDSLPDGEKVPANFYETKKMMNLLKLPKEKIHVCKSICTLFNKECSQLEKCPFCNVDRYRKSGSKVPNMVMTYMPVGPRLQRLFYSIKTAQHMSWHATHRTESGKMIHPSDGMAWKHFDKAFPDFAQETRNIRLGLCTDGFSPNNSNTNSHSCWPVFLTVYNLPPWLALKNEYIQIPVVIPGKKNPGQNLDVFLQPLIDELKMLFNDGIETYDAHQRNNFKMKAVLLWTISDFPAYAMLSGWSTHGKLACPYCSVEAGAFKLGEGGKPCWFDCHRKHLPIEHKFRTDRKNFRKNTKVTRETPLPEPTGDEIWSIVQHFPTVYQGTPIGKKYVKPFGFGDTHNWVKRSIFWELPYWRKLLIRHNLDVMHIEKNFFDNLFHTIMGTLKSKDNLNARKDLELICDRPHLNPIYNNKGKLTKPPANYTLKKDDVKKVCTWLKKVKFPDGYASNIGNCVNTEENNFYGFKSHDCHVFMQRLLPLAIRGFVPEEVYEAVTEMSMFFRVLCSKTLHLDDLKNMKQTVVQTVCKLERIFPPSFFDSMEHLVIHLAEEAIVGGPVQYRWMYRFERKLGLIKRAIRNKAKVEGSIVETHLINELSTYVSLYFDQTIETRHNREPRNFAPEHPNSSTAYSRLSVFVFPSRRLHEKGGKRKVLSHEELHKAHTYILLNCTEVTNYIYMFDKVARQQYPNDPNEPLQSLRDKHFAMWFEKHVENVSDGSAKHLEIIAKKPSQYAQSHKGYFVKGYKFHTQKHGEGRITDNSGVCVRGETYNDEESDYYGILDEVLEIEYCGRGSATVVLFKCTWFDNVRGVIVNKNKLVDVKPKSRLQADDPFILASQAEQVYYIPYPAITRGTKDVWAVIKTKPRGVYEVAEAASEVGGDENMEEGGFFQIDERFELPNEVTNNEHMSLDTNREFDMFDTNMNERIIDEEEEFEEYEDTESDEDDIVFSDHTSDSDELDA